MNVRNEKRYSMFRILTACLVGLLFVGCSDVNEIEPAHLLETEPTDGAHIYYHDSITFIFDKPVQLVKVYGINALPKFRYPTNQWYIWAKQLEMIFPKYVSDPPKKVTLNITYQDNGDLHQATVSFFFIGMIGYHSTPILITNSNVRGRGKTLNAEFLNANGITISFTKPVIAEKGCIEIKPVGGDPLGWIAKWESSSVTLTPLKGQGLVNGTEYVVEIKNVEDAIGQELNTQITFTTTD